MYVERGVGYLGVKNSATKYVELCKGNVGVKTISCNVRRIRKDSVIRHTRNSKCDQCVSVVWRDGGCEYAYNQSSLILILCNMGEIHIADLPSSVSVLFMGR